ncbi:hypothetical protein PHJA_001925200 [Phtheirospermum japonicum]|uniref:BED-type domain-containing protein n=1 Tax=Phtheirospermum japonicum TaxID=374723 RepID=A0A830CU15_9LAMI|nr:hypothetical protein PHJA_001925200 [Phtheirospermum japonicum]
MDRYPKERKDSRMDDQQSDATYEFNRSTQPVVAAAWSLVTYAICGDFGLKATIGKAEILIFTSIQLPGKIQRFHGKPYLWGVFKGQVTDSHQSEHHLHIRTPIVKLSLSANSCGQRSFDGKESPMTVSSEHSPLTHAAKADRRGRRLDEAWQHAKPLDSLRQKAECNYCGFISSHGGISRLKAHLGGGHPKIRLPGCNKVPTEVKKVMADWFDEWVKTTKALWTKEIRAEAAAHDEKGNVSWDGQKTDFKYFSFDFSRGEISQHKAWPETKGADSVRAKNPKASVSPPETKGAQSDKRGRPLDNAWQHAKPLDEARQKTQCNYCGFVSMYGGISRLKAHLGGGCPEMQLQGCPQAPLEVKGVMEEWPLEDTWEHAIPLDETRQATKCKYCGFVSRRGGIARLRAHLVGGDLTMQLEGCPYVPPEVRSSMMMAGVETKKYRKKSKANLETAGGGVEQETTASMASEAHWFERRHHILQETLEGVRNTCLKESLQKLIHEKNANLQKMQFEIHSLQNRYCLDAIPGTFDELVHWVCGDDCEGEAQYQSSIRNHDIIPSHTRDLIVVGKDEHVPTNVDSVDYDESAKDRAIIVLHSEEGRKICPESLLEQINDGARKEKDKLKHPIRLIIKGIPKKIKKKKRRKIKSTTGKKDEHTLDDVVTSWKDENKEEVQVCSDITLPSLVKDDKVSKKRDKKRVSSKSSKKKKTKKKKPVILSEENLPENKPEDEKNFEEENYSPSKDKVIDGELEDKCEKIIEDVPKSLHISTAEPVAMPIWTGGFDILNEKWVMLNGILAHVSILACGKVYDEALQFRPVLQLQMLPKNDVWPKSFENEQDFDRLVDEMMRNELALKATVQNAELLIFNSSELPLLYWKFQGKYYLWGVFRQKQSSPSNSHPCWDEEKDKNPIKPNNTDKTSLAKTVRNGLSPRSPLSNSG